MYVPKLNSKNLYKNIDLRKSKDYVVYVNQLIDTEFKRIKNKLIENFNNHPVTQEIEAGPNSINLSNTLGGVGNLFSFIGFETNSKPIQPIRNILHRNTELTKIIIKKDGTFRTNVFYPKAQDIFNITPLPWAEGRSWAEGIERGLSGFGFYLNGQSVFSRSGFGLQVNNNLRPGKFENTQYISHLIKQFEKDIFNLNRMKF